ncbi:hypothetical protein BC826DRAFT_968287 [Russula brevipes]|nr:hypothetical protein BC826DRAFT_968287 [Russula brevipes]
MARDSPSSYFYSSQPSSSQSRPDDDDEVDRAFWQSTPTCLEELRQRTDGECPLLSQPLGASLTRDLTAAVSDDRDAGRARAGPAEDDEDDEGDPLCLSTQQARLLRHTWLSSPPAASTAVRSSLPDADGEARAGSSSHSESQCHGRGTAKPDPKASMMMMTTTAQISPPAADHPVFSHLENIEKACQTVDERMRQRKIQKEWTNRMISEAARLGDEVGREDVDGERPLRKCLADVAQVADDRFLEEVPTSQSQERYLSLSDLSPYLSQTTGFPEPSFEPIDDDHVDAAITSVISP